MTRKKETKSFTVNEKNARFVEDLDNASSVIDDLLDQYRKGAEKEVVALEMRLEQKRRELREAERKVERLREDVDEIGRLMNTVKSGEDKKLKEAREKLDGVEKEPTNPAIQHWAKKLGMAEQELIAKL